MNVQPLPAHVHPPADLAGLGRLLTEHATLPMAVLEGARHIVRHINPAFCRLAGQSPGELVGQPFAQTMPDKREGLALLDRVYRTGIAENYLTQEPADPRPLTRSYKLWPIGADDHPVGLMIQVTEALPVHFNAIAMNEALLLGSVHQHELADVARSANALLKKEINERRQVEQALRLAQAQLSDRAGQLEGLVAHRTAELTTANQQMEAFVYTIAHDLRAPLRSMQGFSALMVGEVGTVLGEKGRDYADRVDKSAQFMDAMLRDLLAFSRISQQDVELTSVNLGAAVGAVLARLEKDIQDLGGQVDRSGFWPAVLAHESTLAQILFNLTSNALKFVAPGVPPVVRLWAEEKGEFIRVWVEDNGPGIAPDFQGQIFRLFNRLHGGKYPGTGIGLAIVKKGVERMGGRAGVESVPGQGSRFWFELARGAAPESVFQGKPLW